MSRCTIIGRLEDEYGIKPESLTEREKALIGFCTNQFLGNEEQVLRMGNLSNSEEHDTTYLVYLNGDWIAECYSYAEAETIANREAMNGRVNIERI